MSPQLTTHAAGLGVLQGVEQQVLGDAPDLDRIALDRQGGDAERLQIELLGLGHRPEVVAESAQHVGGVERRDPSHLLAGVQAGQVGDVVEQAVQRVDVVLQQAEKGLAARLRQVAQGETLGDVRHHAEIAAQVVRGLLPELGPAAFQRPDVVQRRFEVAHRAGRLEPLQAEVLRRALARRLADEPGQGQTSLRLHLRRRRVVGEVAVELGHQAQMQRRPTRA